MRCQNCGSHVTVNMKYCEKCGTSLNTDENLKKKVKNRMFDLSNGEVEVKTYHCTTLKDPMIAEGYITVTNKRVIYYAFGESSKTFNEVYINKVTGISSYYGTGRIILFLKIAIVLGIIGAISFYMNIKTISLVFFAAFLIFLLLYFLRKSEIYKFNILAEGSDKSPINIGAYGGEITGQGASIAVQAMPTNETHIMMKELGAMILDLKNLGDHAINIWSEKNKQENENVQIDIDENSNKENMFS